MQNSQLVPSLIPGESGSELTETASVTTQQGFSFERISQTILKLIDSAGVEQYFQTPSIAQPVLEAMQQLVGIVARLRSPSGGWPTELAYTPENLATYVTEEIYEVLDAFQAHNPIAKLELGDRTHLFQQYLPLHNLIPRLLWYVARSSYDLMQLLGGTKAKVLHPDHGWQSGMLRLVVILEVEASNLQWSMDLVTNQPPQTALATDALVCSNEGHFCKQPTYAAALLQRLMQQVELITPEAKIFTHRSGIELLEPGQDWQSGSIQLKLDLVFMADESPTQNVAPLEIAAPTETALDSNPIASEVNPNTLTQSLVSEILVRLADKVALDSYIQTLIKQQLETVVFQMQASGINTNQLSPTDEQNLSLLLIRSADSVVDTIQTLVELSGLAELSEHAFSQPEILVDEWMPKLLWDLTRTSYEVMQLIGGVKAKVLQPERGWMQGIFRVLAVLQVSVEDTHWQLDLSTGQVLRGSVVSLDEDVVVQSNESDLCQQPNQARNLLAKVLKEIQANVPFLQVLVQGAKIELLDMLAIEKDWQPGLMHLKITLELLGK